jgi:HK97 gp10 family phage protein
MAVEASFQVDGFEELFVRMDQIKEEIGKGKTDKVWRNMLKSAMTPVLEEAQRLAPKDTGQLADHIYLKVHRPMARDKSGKAYTQGEIYMARVTASTLRDDTVYNLVLNKRNRFQTIAVNKKPVPVSSEFGNAKVPAQPFLLPSLRKHYGTMENIMASQLRIFIESFDRSKARGG